MFRHILAEQKGTITVFFAVCLVVLIGMLGMVIDVGNLYLQKAKLQNTVDAAALAGAAKLPNKEMAKTEAINYAGHNGNVITEPEITITKYDSRITVSHTNTVDTPFMKLFGIDTVPVGALATAEAAGPFKYAIFSGSKTADMNIKAWLMTIQGSVHSNRNLRFGGGWWNSVTGTAEAVEKISVDWLSDWDFGGRSPNVSAIEMPDFSKQIIDDAGSKVLPDTQPPPTIDSFSNLTGSIYAKGSLNIDGFIIKSAGGIIAERDITISGAGMKFQSKDQSNQVCLYSRNGNITIEESALAGFNGILYAPKGKITIKKIALEYFNGSIVGNQVIMEQSLGVRVLNRTDFQNTTLPNSVALVQ